MEFLCWCEELASDALIFSRLTLWFCVVETFYSHISTINDVTTNCFGANLFSCFRFLLTVTESQGFSKDICRSMVAMLDTDHSGKLGLEEFKSLLNDIAKWKVSFYF
jgi:hypothetical protein